MRFESGYLKNLHFIEHKIDVIPCLYQPCIMTLFANPEDNATLQVDWTPPATLVNEFNAPSEELLKDIGGLAVGFGGAIQIPRRSLVYEDQADFDLGEFDPDSIMQLQDWIIGVFVPKTSAHVASLACAVFTPNTYTVSHVVVSFVVYLSTTQQEYDASKQLLTMTLDSALGKLPVNRTHNITLRHHTLSDKENALSAAKTDQTLQNFLSNLDKPSNLQ